MALKPLLAALLFTAVPFAASAQDITIHRGTGTAIITTDIRIDDTGFEPPQTITRGALRTADTPQPAPASVTTTVTLNLRPGTRLTDRARHAPWYDWTRSYRLARNAAW